MPELKSRLRYMRIALGVYLLVYYSRLLPNLTQYFGPESMIHPGLLITPRLSFLFLFWTNTAVYLSTALVMGLAAAFTAGYGLRWVHPLLFLVHLSFHHANPYIIHEPQQLTNLLLLLSLFLPLDGRREPNREDLWIINALIAYLGAYYFLAGAKKLSDPLWRQGLSLWHLMQWPPFALDNPVARFFIEQKMLTRVGVYFTLTFELSFLALAFTRLRWCLVAMGAFFHVMIFLTLQVGTFPYVLAPWYALMLDPITLNTLSLPWERWKRSRA